MIALVFVSLIIGVSGHSYLINPSPRLPNTGYQGSSAVCDNLPIQTGNNVTVQAGRAIALTWAQNQHSGTADVQFWCGPAAVNPTILSNVTGAYTLWANSAGKTLFDFDDLSEQIVVPSTTTPGEYTCVWYWFGPWYSCIDMKVIANDGTFICQTNADCNYVPPKSLVYGAPPGSGGTCNVGTGKCKCLTGYSGQTCNVYTPSSSASSLSIISFVAIATIMFFAL